MRLRSIAASFLLLCLSSGFVYLSLPAPLGGAVGNLPGLEASRPVAEFGRIMEGRKQNATFELVNRSNTTMLIRTAIQNCDCSATTISERKVAAGRRVSVGISWDTKGRSGPSVTSVRIIYSPIDDPVHTRDLELSLKGDVTPRIVYQPERLTFVSDDQIKSTQALRIILTPGIEAKIKEVFTNHPAFRAELVADQVVNVTHDRSLGEGLAISNASLFVKTIDDEHIVPINCKYSSSHQ